jgi:hypothetical protein
MGKTFGIENSAYHNIAAQFANLGILGARNNPQQMAYLQSQLDSAAAQGAVAAAEQAERDRKRQARKDMLVNVGKEAAFMGANLLLPGSGTALSMADKVAGSPGTSGGGGIPVPSGIGPSGIPLANAGATPDFTNMDNILFGGGAVTTNNLLQKDAPPVSAERIGMDARTQAQQVPAMLDKNLAEPTTPAPSSEGGKVDWGGVLKSAAPSVAGAAVLGVLSNKRQNVKEAGAAASNNVYAARAGAMFPTGAGGSRPQPLAANAPTINTFTPDQIRGMDEQALRSVLNASKAKGIKADLEQSRAIPRELRGEYEGTIANVRKANARTLGAIMLGALAGSRFSDSFMKGDEAEGVDTEGLDPDAYLNDLRSTLEESMARIKAY